MVASAVPLTLHRRSPIAVIDIGSNTTRLVVLDLGGGTDMRLIAEAKATLRLERSIGEGGELSKAAVAAVRVVLTDFAAVAASAGAKHVVAVTTAAFRDATNGKEAAAELKRETGVSLKMLSGAEEARLAFVGAVYSIPVESGILFDIGGGSLEVTEFAKRALVRSWSFPFGALRISDSFLSSDPPTRKEIDRLEKHVKQALEESGVPELRSGGMLVGSGGSIRNLGRMDKRSREYALKRLHGYEASVVRIHEIKDQLCSMTERGRQTFKGLNPERSDSIVGGAIVVSVLSTHVGAKEIVVSGRGLREGIALGEGLHSVPPVSEVQSESVDALGARFATWRPGAAARRAEIATAICNGVGLDDWDGVPRLTGFAARLLDAGSSIDYYNRVGHASTIIEEGDLGGFTHREIALMSAITRQAQRSIVHIENFHPLLSGKDEVPVLQAGTVLAVADEIERRLPALKRPVITVKLRRDRAELTAVSAGAWDPGWLADRFELAFGRSLVMGDA